MVTPIGRGAQLPYPRERDAVKARASRARIDGGRSVLHAFLERTRKAVNHDLRSPLAAIVNYAAVLEEDDAPAADRVQPTMHRIRHHARQVADMLAAMLHANSLAARDDPPDLTSEDPVAFVRAIVIESGFEEMVQPVPADGSPAAAVPLDHDLCRFAVRAFLELESCVRPEARRPLRVSASATAQGTTLALAFSDPTAQPAPLDLDVFLHGYGDEAPRAPRFELALANELFACVGGSIAVRGRPGRGGMLELRLPPA